MQSLYLFVFLREEKVSNFKKIRYKNFLIVVISKKENSYKVAVRHVLHKTELIICSSTTNLPREWNDVSSALDAVMRHIDERHNEMLQQIIDHESDIKSQSE
jgi:hypothetical protein